MHPLVCLYWKSIASHRLASLALSNFIIGDLCQNSAGSVYRYAIKTTHNCYSRFSNAATARKVFSYIEAANNHGLE